ncbi:purine-nucleoside phosphorylase [Desulfobaculum bizertense]|uniref:Purine nucleoside phosphorylase n=1 Tax=Desulfobaculum bizertense DSM 18034 TaxID=1121442 RepID=A0A1T4W8K3_9BACT|nr:purine-nucleoside phosphorylase [Desulfobaculum bizertense]UIJ39197.1 purine-nucleoside phosphorylase [Desulfobaculum bizertense]SKA73596.1 purine-nucleoside phosphorylase [Desulfobaculum bizertense DSM 18034]
MQNPQKVQQAAAYIREHLSTPHEADTGIILGTGLGDWASSLSHTDVFPFESIPGYPRSTVQGHAGQLVAAEVGGHKIWLQQGRFHLYEGYSPAEVCMGVRTLAELGIKRLIITNAAGALNPQFDAGGLMLITDHINFTGTSPLIGPNHDAWGDRFPDMSATYSPQQAKLAMQVAEKHGIRLERGVYLGLVGPNLETPAETRAFRMWGADAVGMSTVLEVIAAKHMGLEILGISCLTNKNLPDCMEETSIEDVLNMAAASSGKLSALLSGILTEDA